MLQIFIFTAVLQWAVGRAVATTRAGEDRKSRAKNRAFMVMFACIAVFLAYDISQLPETLYKCVGVPRVDATKSQIRSSFRKISLEKHPDKMAEKTPESELEFLRIRACYDILNDETKRSNYDIFGPEIAEHPALAEEIKTSVIAVIMRHGLHYMVVFVLFFVGTISRERSGGRPWCNGILLAGFVTELAMSHAGWDPLTGVLGGKLPVHQQVSLLRQVGVYACHCAVVVAQITFVDHRAIKEELLAEINRNQIELMKYLATEPWAKESGVKAAIAKNVGPDGVAIAPRPPNWAQVEKLQQKKAEAERQKEAGRIPWGTIIFLGIVALNWMKE